MSRRWPVAFLTLLACLLGAPWALAQDAVRPVLRTQLARDTAIIGQPIALTISVLVPTWMPKPPVFPSFEMPNLLVRLPEGASGPTSERIDGETWAGVARSYSLSPMAARRFRIPPLPVDVTFADPETRAPVRVRLRTDPVELVGTVPPAARGLVPFLAAESLELEEEIEGHPGELEFGAAFTRTVTARVRGTSPMFVPPLVAPLLADGVAEYPKEPIVTESGARGVPGGTRVERVTYVAEASAHAAAPAVEIRWYNFRADRIETATIAPVKIVAHASLAESVARLDWRDVARGGGVLALVGLCLTLAARRLGPRAARWRRRRREAYQASEACAFAEAIAALRAQRLGDTLTAVAYWSGRLPSTAGEADARLATALQGLGAALYGQGKRASAAEQWQAAMGALRAARAGRLAARRTSNAAQVLPPLNPIA